MACSVPVSGEPIYVLQKNDDLKSFLYHLCSHCDPKNNLRCVNCEYMNLKVYDAHTLKLSDIPLFDYVPAQQCRCITCSHCTDLKNMLWHLIQKEHIIKNAYDLYKERAKVLGLPK